MEILQEYMTLAKDFFTCLSVFVAAGVAVLGFRTWKRQLQWKTRYELAIRLKQAIYRLRDALAQIRNPVGFEVEPGSSQQQAFEALWRSAREAKRDLDALSIEAEAMWEDEYTEKLKPLLECYNTLRATSSVYAGKVQNPQSNVPFRKEDYEILFVEDDEQENLFSDRIAEAVQQMEIFLKPYMKP
jgi:hypothetical protein